MSDFWQHGPITTIHRLPGSPEGDLERSVARHAKERTAALLIPALASEMDGPAWSGIMAELGKAAFLDEVILVLGHADGAEFNRAKTALGSLPARTAVVWPESPNLWPVLQRVKGALDVGPPGKGRDVWIALGYILGRGKVHAVALNDADVVTYTRELPLRLLAPLLHPELSLDFAKGYYCRVSGSSLAGRATRLLVVPLVAVLVRKSFIPALRVIGAMRYALAGEFALTVELASRIPVPRDWGLEVGILSAVARTVPLERICQADLCENYEHKHQELHPQDTTKGLNRMAVEVAATLLREVGQAPDNLLEDYRKQALSLIPRYRADALACGLDYDEARERETVATFVAAVGKAMGMGEDDIPAPLPAWQDVERIVPGLKERIVQAVDRDNS